MTAPSAGFAPVNRARQEQVPLQHGVTTPGHLREERLAAIAARSHEVVTHRQLQEDRVAANAARTHEVVTHRHLREERVATNAARTHEVVTHRQLREGRVAANAARSHEVVTDRHLREERVATIAARQHGVVTHRQLREAGFSGTAIARRLRAGRLRLLHRGVYLALPFPLPRTAEMAAVLACGPGAVLSHVSAAALWGLHGGVPGPVDVTVAGNRGRRPGIRAHRVDGLAREDRTVREGIPVTGPGRTLVDVAGLLPIRDLEQAVARAEREGLVDRETLHSMVARRAPGRGTPALRALLGAPGGPVLTRSLAESKLLTLIREAGLPAPECNVSVGRYEVDFLWRAAGIAVEVDGFRYHATRPRFERDRRKDAELVAAGLTVLRLSWRQLTEEAMATAVRLGQARARPGRQG